MLEQVKIMPLREHTLVDCITLITKTMYMLVWFIILIMFTQMAFQYIMSRQTL